MSTSSSSPAATETSSSSRTPILIGLLALAVVVGGYFGFRHFLYFRSHEETDDAQVECHISPVLPRVSGYVAEVLVKDNEQVTAGQPLVVIDPHELDLRIASAEAAQRSAEAGARTADAALANAVAAQAVTQA